MRRLAAGNVCLAVLLVAGATLVASGRAFAADWMQFGYDAAHTGFNPAETTINAGNVAKLTMLYEAAFPVNVDSAPVYLSNVETPNGTKNLLFGLSEFGRLMAIDAATGAEIWHVVTTGNSSVTNSSPAIDPNRQYVYSYGMDGNVHKYQVGDGTEITGNGWPQLVTLKPVYEKVASGLTIAETHDGTYLLVVTNGYFGDAFDYQGHLVSIDLANGAQRVFNAMCSDLDIHFVVDGTPGVDDCNYNDDPPMYRRGRMGGIWGRGGATYDVATNRAYIATGNGDFSANAAGFDWGDSVLALAPDGTGSGGGMPLDSYTPDDFQFMYWGDADLGSTSTVIMQPPIGSTATHVGVQIGKDHVLRLMDLDDMSGQGGPSHVGGELQLINVPQGGDQRNEQPATWVDSAGDSLSWLFVASPAGLAGLTLGLDASNRPALIPVWQAVGSPTSPIVANDILYAIDYCGCVVARNPTTGDELWRSDVTQSFHWQSPIVVDGVIYAFGLQKLVAFGLPVPYTVTPTANPGGTIQPDTPQTVDDGDTISFTITPVSPPYAIADVTGCDGSLAGDVYTTGPITADCTVTATFAIVDNEIIFQSGFDP